MKRLPLSSQLRATLLCIATILVVGLVGRTHPPTVAIEVSPNSSSPAIIQSPPSTAAALFQNGKTHYQLGQYQDAIQTWDQASQLFGEQGDTLNHAMTSSNLALAYYQLGNWEAANGAINHSLNMLTPEPSDSSIQTDYHRVKAQTLNNQGILQLAQGQAKEAYGTWQNATALYEQINDDAGIIRSLINQAQALSVEGHYLQARTILQGDSQGADGEHSQEDSVIQRLATQPASPLKATGLRMLGNILFLTGDRNKAIEVLDESLAIAQQLNAPDDIATTLLLLGKIAESAHQSQKAIDLYQQAAAATTNPLIETQAQLHQLRVFIAQKQGLDAQSLVTELKGQLDQLPLSRSSIDAQINLARSLLDLSDLMDRDVTSSQNSLSLRLPTSRIEEAIEQLVNARQRAKQLNDKPTESYALGTLADAYQRLNQPDITQSLSLEAIGLAQSTNALDILYRWQWQLGRLYETQYNNASLDKNSAHSAQTYLQQAIEAYDAAYVTLRKLQPDLAYSPTDFRFTFLEQVTEPVYRGLVNLLLKAEEPSQKDLLKAQQVMESLYISGLENFLKRQCDLFLSPEFPENTDSAIIYPILLDDRIELIYKLPGQKTLSHKRTWIAKNEIEQLINQFKPELEKEYTFRAIETQSNKLYHYLLEPIRDQLNPDDIQTLVFILDGGLRSIPMATLYDGQHYLIEDYGVAQALSLQLTVPEKLPKRLRVLAAGLTTEPPAPYDQDFSKLLNVGRELNAIQQTQMNVASIQGDDFKVADLGSAIDRTEFQIVHLATHGRFSEDPEDTFLLAADASIQLDNLSRILQSDDDDRTGAIELLILSACETATGNDRAVLGMAGIAVQAVARSTIASLWSLDDSSSADFMGQLYQQLEQGDISRAEALRQAQLSMLKDQRYKHPRYWAPFVLVGNWQ